MCPKTLDTSSTIDRPKNRILPGTEKYSTSIFRPTGKNCHYFRFITKLTEIYVLMYLFSTRAPVFFAQGSRA